LTVTGTDRVIRDGRSAVRGGRGRSRRRPGHGGRDRDQLTWYGDSAYGTGDLREAIATAGHQAVIKPWPLQPAVEGCFTADDFTVDAAAGTVTCPAGITRQVTTRNAVIFGVACQSCPLRERCTTSKHGRTLHLHEHDSLLRAARADWAAAAPGLREDYMTHRPHVERTLARVATWRGRRLKLRYRGAATNDAWLRRRTAAINLRNLLGRGLARRQHLGAGHLTSRRPGPMTLAG
jgi:Transposase DDE domain